MNHVTREELILYLNGVSLSDAEKAAIEEKLRLSPDSQIALEKLKQQMTSWRQENERERELIFDHLLDYLDGKITQVNGLDFAQLLEAYPDCKAVYQLLQQELTLDEAAQLDYPVSEELRRQFDYLIVAPAAHPALKQISDTLASKFAEAFYRFLVEPLVEPAFLGEATGNETKIKITGHAFSIDVGAPQRLVKVFSQDWQELEAKVSDANGIVNFQDFEPDEYWIKVEGFKIRDVRQVR